MSSACKTEPDIVKDSGEKSGKSDQFIVTATTNTDTVPTVASTQMSVEIQDDSGSGFSSSLELSREKAAPIYAKPRGTGKKIYKTEIGENGQRLMNYVLFEDSINKAKVRWQSYSEMTTEERDIYMAHLKAIRERRLNYKDPKTGYVVMAVSQLLLNGKCCGNGCRHCPYEHENASEEIKKSKIWNGAFYV